MLNSKEWGRLRRKIREDLSTTTQADKEFYIALGKKAKAAKMTRGHVIPLQGKCDVTKKRLISGLTNPFNVVLESAKSNYTAKNKVNMEDANKSYKAWLIKNGYLK